MLSKISFPLQLLLALIIAGLTAYAASAALPPRSASETSAGQAAAVQQPVAAPQQAQPSPEDLFGLNGLGSQEQGGVRLEVARVVIGRKDLFGREGRNLDELGQLRGDALIGELILKVTNTSDSKVAVPVDEGVVVINDEQIRYRSGDENAPYLLPGGMQITSHLFVVNRSTIRQVRQIVLRVARPVDEQNNSLGEDFVLNVDLTRREYQPRKVK